jgi:CBS domain-containing protein
MRPRLTTADQDAHAVADGKDLEQTRIHDLMTARPTVINPTASIPDGATLMSRGHFRHLPVSGDTGLQKAGAGEQVSALLRRDPPGRPTSATRAPWPSPPGRSR